MQRRTAIKTLAAASLTSNLWAQRGLRINIGTVAPPNSAWHEILQQMQQDWEKISGGKVQMRVYPGGSLGDDAEMLRKVRVGQLQGVAMTGIGLALIDDGVDALHIPMLFDSYAELDHVRAEMAPKLEARLLDKGFHVLNWSDGGWAQFFTKRPAKTLDDIREQKLWISAGDAKTERLYKQFGMDVVPLPLSEVSTGLQSGLIEAITVPPLYALLDGTFQRADNMTDIKWAPVIAGTVIAKEAWEKIPASMRPQLAEAAERAGEQTRSRIRKLGDDAVEQMKSRGLNVVAVDKAAWQKEVEAAWPKLRGVLAPADLFDEAIRLRNQGRKG
ncbi:MAG: TRAP transporter substrate-binding protein DctP [Bryobacterales bacterium]